MGRLEGKVAVVTGGANGIGRACAERFAEEGADVVIGDVLDASDAVAAVQATGRRVLARELDVRDRDANEALMQAAVDELGGLDVVVTAAGISHAGYVSGVPTPARSLPTSPPTDRDVARQFTELGLDDWQEVLDVNLTGTLFALQAAARRMVERDRGGSLITISSLAATDPNVGPAAYGVSKAGVCMLTRQTAKYLGPLGIRANSIAPGAVRSNFSAVLESMPGAAEAIEAALPLRRIGLPIDVAHAAVFLASDESSFFTGKILHPDGGHTTG